MKNIRLIDPNDDYFYHKGDCERIQKILAANGYKASLEQCKFLWETYSDSLAAGWLILPEEDEQVLSNISPYFEEEED